MNRPAVHREATRIASGCSIEATKLQELSLQFEHGAFDEGIDF